MLDRIERVGIDLEEVFVVLEQQGVSAFETAYRDLLKAIEQKAALLSSRATG